MADLERARRDIQSFAAINRWDLTGWQALALALTLRITCIVAPRQSGKSYALAILALFWAYREPGHRVLIVSAGQEQVACLLPRSRSLPRTSHWFAGDPRDRAGRNRNDKRPGCAGLKVC